MNTKRIFIGIFGRKNKGKSSLINAITRQDIAIVSSTPGTTTDPVKKTMELFGIGPAVFIDTAGVDDYSELGPQRVKKTMDTIPTIDVAIVVLSHNEFADEEKNICTQLIAHNIPFLCVHNKSDICTANADLIQAVNAYNVPLIQASTINGTGIDDIINTLVKITPPSAYQKRSLIGDKIHPNDLIVLVMPQDEEAPEGRLILPQVQLIRDIIDNHAVAVCLQPEELPHYMAHHQPHMVITDSQVFHEVNKVVPAHIPLTGFSIILARAKGNFEHYIAGTPHLSQLQNGDKILLLESCSHPTHCEDIGRVKLPKLIQKFTGKKLQFDMVSALNPLPDLTPYAMAIQCGACMVTDKQVSQRIKSIINANIPVSNYGMSIAYANNIFNRAVEIFVK